MGKVFYFCLSLMNQCTQLRDNYIIYKQLKIFSSNLCRTFQNYETAE